MIFDGCVVNLDVTITIYFTISYGFSAVLIALVVVVYRVRLSNAMKSIFGYE